MLPTRTRPKVLVVKARAGSQSVGPRSPSLARRLVTEGIGTALLLATVVGSGIMAERLAGGNVAIALLANTIATGAALVALILTFGGISGAHFNPVVTIFDAASGGRPWRDVAPYIGAQVVGGIVGVLAAHARFDIKIVEVSQHVRSGVPLMFSEFIATFGLIAVIWGVAKKHPTAVPYAVGGYITAAY